MKSQLLSARKMSKMATMNEEEPNDNLQTSQPIPNK